MSDALYKELRTYLVLAQQANGWFPATAISEDSTWQEKIFTPYFSLLIGSILTDDNFNFSTDLEVAKIITKLRRAVHREASPDNTYNYWLRRSHDARTRPIPDDWDDTALAYAVLLRSREDEQPHAYPLLRNARNKGIPLVQTWIFPGAYPKKWTDYDIWVNLNVLYWLIQEEVLLPDVWRECTRQIIRQNAQSRYYLDYHSADFFYTRTALRILRSSSKQVSPAMKRETRRALAIIEKRTQGFLARPKGKSIDLAWRMATWRLLGEKPAVGHLRSFLNNPRLESIILGWQQPNRIVYDGAPALTAALFLAALTPRPTVKTPALPAVRAFPVKFRPLITHLQRSDFTKEIMLLPYEVCALLRVRAGRQEPAQSRVNLLAWAYYWLDDQRIDQHPLTIPVPESASVFRLYHEEQQKLVKAPSFWNSLHQMQKTYEKAASQEAQRLRFNPFENPVHLPHIPWSRFYAAKFAPYLQAVIATATAHHHPSLVLEAAYRQYLLAKQISDDARDCLEDIRAGRLTICTGAVLARTKHPISKLSDKEIERLFLEYVADNLTQKILFHLKRAKEFGQKLPGYAGSSLATRLEKIEAQTIMHRRRRAEVRLIQASSATSGIS